MTENDPQQPPHDPYAAYRRPEDAAPGAYQGESPQASRPEDLTESGGRVLPPWPGATGQPEDTTRFAQPYAAWAPPAPERPRSAKGLTAAVLAGALLLGGAAGVGGSAAYQAFVDDGGSTTGQTTSGRFEATRTAAVEDGTVEKVASEVLPSVVKVNVTTSSGAGSGSGIVLSDDGEILTNNHVVAGAGDGGQISVSFNDGTTKRATVVGTDPLVDIAVIKVEDPEGLVPASIGKSGDLKVGQTVVAVGSPFGLNATVTSGIVSALNRPVSVSTEQEQEQQGADLSTTYPAIQTDAAINPGNSGGPLVDMSGRVVGINSSIRTDSSGGLSGSQGGSIGLGFAIPIDEILPIVNQIVDGETPTHARLGVSVTDVQGSTLAQGAQLAELEAGGSAADAGLRDGDVITKVDDQAIDGSESLVATIRGHRPGDQVEITYVRDGKTATTTATLGSDAQNQDS